MKLKTVSAKELLEKTTFKLNIDTEDPIKAKSQLFPENELHANGHPTGLHVSIGDVHGLIGPEDTCNLVRYWLTNTDLSPSDPRLTLIRQIAGGKIAQGWNRRNKRIHLPEREDYGENKGCKKKEEINTS